MTTKEDLRRETPEQRERRLVRSRAYTRTHRRQINAKRYGIPLEIYDATLVAQNGECAICQQPMARPHLDHCHATDRPRAFLCARCNTAIGLFKENVGNLRAAIGYLEAWQRIIQQDVA